LLIFIFAWVYAKVKGINPTAILTGKFSEKDLNTFNVLSSSTLGQGKDIHLVEINGKQLVIGSTTSNINLLTEISPEDVEKLKDKKHKHKIDEKNDTVELPEEEDIYYESIDDEDFIDSEFYSSKYSEVYKEYIDKKGDEETP
jgi:flagellar biogenesis protein FliO